MTSKPRLGISACLLGERVRYDGQHKYDVFLVETLGKYVEYVPVCPEVGCGLPVPREAMHLEGDPAKPRLIATNTRRDLTDQMLTWVARKIVELEKENLCGFVFKSKSPSSGMERVKVYNGKGMLSGRAPGLFAGAFIKHFPLLPAEDEGRLHDPELRGNFIGRIFALNRLREAAAERRSASNLMKFHARHKYLILAHSDKHLRLMGKLVAHINPGNNLDTWTEYEKLLLAALAIHATPKRHANVLEHMLGFFKKQLAADEKQELMQLISAMRKGETPLIAPLTLLRHYIRKYNVSFLAEQYYIDPEPAELALLYHA